MRKPNKQTRIYITILYLIFICTRTFAGEEMKNLNMSESEKKTKIILALESFKKSRPTITDWKLHQRENGIIETDWYRDHKGEVELKIRVDVKADPPEVLVLQKTSWLWFFSKESNETDWAKKTKQFISDYVFNNIPTEK